MSLDNKKNNTSMVQLMKETAIIPVFYEDQAKTAIDIIDACYLGGARVFEFTNRGSKAKKIFAQLKKHLTKKYPDAILGIGSIVNKEQTKAFLKLGADFIVSPILSIDIASYCNKKNVLWIPGCGTATELYQAHELGAKLTKLFPAEQIGGPNFVKAVKAPMPWLTIMPTGGVKPTEENLKGWFNAGVICVGMGSALLTKDLIENKNFSEITSLMQKSIAYAKQYTSN